MCHSERSEESKSIPFLKKMPQDEGRRWYTHYLAERESVESKKREQKKWFAIISGLLMVIAGYLVVFSQNFSFTLAKAETSDAYTSLKQRLVPLREPPPLLEEEQTRREEWKQEVKSTLDKVLSEP